MSHDPNDFPASVILAARKLAAFKCCYCRDRMGDEVHHLVPKGEGGSNDLDNAILLCSQCHTDYGHRNAKRQQLRQARDDWYEIVRRRYAPPDVDTIERIENLATKGDINELKIQLDDVIHSITVWSQAGSTSPREIANIASTMISSLSTSPSYSASPSASPSPSPAMPEDEDDPFRSA